MNKKLFGICLLLVVVASISAVSAFDFGDLFGMGDQNETVTIGGIDFNIPAGFKEDQSGLTNGVVDALKEAKYKVDGKTYSKGSTGVGLFVANFSDFEIDGEEMLSDFAGDDGITINNVGGFMEVDDDVNIFCYVKDNCFVVVSSNDKNVIGDFVIA